jgi:sugar phosphate permease
MLKKYLLELLVAITVVLAPIKAVMITVGILVFVDKLFGVWAAKKRGEKFSSARMSHSVTKALVYQSAVITGFLVEKYLMDGALPVCKIIAGLIGSVELKSLLESGQEILGQPVFKAVVSTLKPKVEEKLTPPDEEEKKD